MEILLGQVPEALYFALFMIYTKKLSKRRILFIGLMLAEYLLLLNALPFSIWSHILYFAVSYMILKILYKEKTQITDIFTLGLASLMMIIVNLIVYVVFLKITNNYIITTVINRICLFLLLFFLRKRLPKIQNLYKKFWNRNDKVPKPMKSVTFRCINLFILNIMFYAINVCMLYCIYKRG